MEHAFKSQVSINHGRGRGRGRNSYRGGISNPSSSSGRGNNQNSSQNSSQNQAQSQSYDKSLVQCHYCKNYCHYSNECGNKQYDNREQNANFTKENQNQGSMFLSCNVAQKQKKDVWFLD